MTPSSREAVWVLLSELFVDTEHSKQDLLAMGRALQEIGFSAEVIETILCREVAPVCGRAQDLKDRIESRLCKPWYKPPFFNAGLVLMPGVKRDWEIVRNAMRCEPGT